MDEALVPTDDPQELEARLAMPLVEAMLTQRAVRRVDPAPVDDNIVMRCIELALEAPTGSNGQNWEWVIVKDQAVKAALGAQYRRVWKLYGTLGRLLKRDAQTTRILKSVQWQVEHFEEIPVLVVCCLRGGSRVPFLPLPPVAVSSHYGSVYPSVQNLLLAARSVGLGASLITLPLWSNTVARRILKVPIAVQPCCIVALGWPKGHYGRKPRKAVGTVVHLDRYGNRPGYEDRGSPADAQH
jgi:nitroreductase